jgi:5'-deoxy-5'-methylthioadenosine phosphorylase
MALIGIIGGSGLTEYSGLAITHQQIAVTPFGLPSANLTFGYLDGHPVVFLPRHGNKHSIAPHKINYRANIAALKQAGVSAIVAVASVGGITEQYGPGVLAVPDQIIDYTHGREQSFFSDDFSANKHLDFTWPYTPSLRETLLAAGKTLSINMVDGGTYGAVQGPRLETAAEIKRMAQDGCDLVGMTGMPEAYLAREQNLPYVTLAVVANWAAGLSAEPLSMEAIEATMAEGIDQVRAVIAQFIVEYST